MKRQVIVGVITLAISTAGCRDATEPVGSPQVAVAVQPMGGSSGDTTVSVEGRLRSVVISGAAGLGCGASAAQGHAVLRSELLQVYLTFEPLGSCPFVGTNSQFTAVVTEVPPGRYDLEVIVKYWEDQPTRVLVDASVSVTD